MNDSHKSNLSSSNQEEYINNNIVSKHEPNTLNIDQSVSSKDPNQLTHIGAQVDFGNNDTETMEIKIEGLTKSQGVM